MRASMLRSSYPLWNASVKVGYAIFGGGLSKSQLLQMDRATLRVTVNVLWTMMALSMINVRPVLQLQKMLMGPHSLAERGKNFQAPGGAGKVKSNLFGCDGKYHV